MINYCIKGTVSGNLQLTCQVSLLNIYLLLACSIVVFYPQNALSESNNGHKILPSHEKVVPFPSALFGDDQDEFYFKSTVKQGMKPKIMQKPTLKTYGPVSGGDNLWIIAEKLRSNNDVMIVQMAVALFKKNPSAFINNNINGLRMGSFLIVPEKTQVIQLSRNEAKIIFQEHWLRWKKNPQGNNSQYNKNNVSERLIETSLSKTGNLNAQVPPIISTIKLVEGRSVNPDKFVQKQGEQVSLLSLPNKILLFVSGILIALFYFVRKQSRVTLVTEEKDPPIPILEQLLNKQALTVEDGSLNACLLEQTPCNDIIDNLGLDYVVHNKDNLGLREMDFEAKSTNNGFQGQAGNEFKHEADRAEQSEDALACNLLDSTKGIQQIHDLTRDTRINAFLEITQPENLPEEVVLLKEIYTIKESDKFYVFLEEIEPIFNKLSSQAVTLKKAPDELENLIEFKISVHLIKVLSEMMQAKHLRHYSQTVIEFLENIVAGKTTMTVEFIERLSNVVKFYEYYIDSVKNDQSLAAWSL